MKGSFRLPHIRTNVLLPTKNPLTTRSRSKISNKLNEGLQGVAPPSISENKFADIMRKRISRSYLRENNSHSVLEFHDGNERIDISHKIGLTPMRQEADKICESVQIYQESIDSPRYLKEKYKQSLKIEKIERKKKIKKNLKLDSLNISRINPQPNEEMLK